MFVQGISSSSRAANESENVDGSIHQSTESNEPTYGDRRVLHQLSASSGGCRRSRANNSHHMISITDYSLPITVSYLNYLKQRKVRSGFGSVDWRRNKLHVGFSDLG
jgi:hypothetical protein